MSSSSLGIIIELLVAGLLVMTIGYCIVLNSRLKNLRADEQFLKTTISELISATEIAERAILGLKATTQDAEQQLGQKLRDAQFLHGELKRMTAPYAAPSQQSPVQTQYQPPREPAMPQQRVIAHQPVQHMPPVHQPHVSQALASFERDMTQAPQRQPQRSPQHAQIQQQIQEPSAPAPAARDFRVFTRSAFNSRNSGS